MSQLQPIETNLLATNANAPDTTVKVSDPSPASSSVTAEPTAPQAAKTEPIVSAKRTPDHWLWLTKLDQTFVTIVVAGLLVLSGYHWATLGGWGMRPIEIERQPERRYDFRLDINSASWVEWTQIEGIGEATANKIVADRDSNGPFRSIEGLLRVKGIGPKTLEKMRPFLRDPNETPGKVKGTL